MTGHIYVRPEALHAAAADLDAVAARLQASLSANAPALTVPPSGSEEVSVLAAGYFGTLAESFVPAAMASIAELHETAAALRAQAIAYENGDHEFGTQLAAGGPQ